MTQPITQRSFIRGVDASTSRFDQPKGSLPRLSNLLFTRRGALITVDGSQQLSTPTNKFNPTASQGSIVAIQQYLTGASIAAGQSVPSGSYVPAGAGSDQNRSGEVWFAPGNVATTNSFADCGLVGNGDFSDYLVATGFNFNIPSGAIINGVQVKINRYYTNSGGGTVRDSIVSLVKANVVTGANRSAGVTWPFNTPAIATFGANNDLWTLTLTPADVNLPTFGVAFAVTSTGNPSTTSQDALAGQVTMAITYTGAGGTIQTQVGQTIFYLQDSNPGSQLGEVTGLVGVPVNAPGGTLTVGNTYNYGVLVLDGQQNSTIGTSVGVTVTAGNNAVKLTWNAVLGAGSYLIIGGTVAAVTNASPRIGQVFQPDFQQNVSGAIGGPTATFTDTGAGAITLTNLPYGNIIFGSTNNTVGPLRLFSISAINTSQGQYYDPVLLAQFPCRAVDLNIPNNPPIDASGGVVGGSGQVPQLIQFAGLIVVILGNGFRPQYTDGTTVFPFTNTFTSLYVTWTASVTHLVGDIIKPLTPNGHIFICTQGGASAGAEPGWNTGTGQTTLDNQVLWKENGLLQTSPILPGAAHVTNHAGSLWAFNTSPTNTSNGLDGPSALRMSDSNNLKSMNPLNAAFIGKDDGSVGMGLASFTIAELGITPLGSLIAFKDYSTYQIVGVFGSPNFTIQQAQTNMGCKASRSIKFVSGFGIVRFAHLGFALFDGVRDKVISEQIRPFIFGSPSVGSSGLSSIRGIDLNHVYLMKADECANPPMYLAAAPLTGSVSLQRIFAYDLVLKAWAIIDLPVTVAPSSYISSLYQVRTPGIEPFVIVGGYDNGSIQIIQNGANLWNLSTVSAAVAWAFTTPEIFNTGDPSGEVYAASMLIRGTNLDGLPITVNLNIQTEAGTIQDPRTFNIGIGEFEIFIGINEQAISFNSLISGTGRVEIESVTWNVQPKPAGVPSVLT